MVNKLYYKDKDLIKELKKLRGYELGTWEHFMQYMRIICSFGKHSIMTDRGIEYADELLTKWKDQEELTRDEIFCMGFLTTEVLILRNDIQQLPLVQKYYGELKKKYSPDFEYLQEFAQKVLLEKGYVMDNPQQSKEVEKMFEISSHYMAVTPLGRIPKKDKDLK